MDRTERIFKVALDIVLTIIFIYAFNLFYHTWLVVPFSYLISHTINWLFNGQLFVLLKNLNLVYNSADVFRDFSTLLYGRIRRENSIALAAAFGSLSRDELKPSSDLDIRVIRKAGLINGFKACFFVAYLRSLSLFHSFPLDIYLLDDVANLRRHIHKSEINKILIVKDCNNILKNFRDCHESSTCL